MKFKDLPEDIRTFLDAIAFRYSPCSPDVPLHIIITNLLRYRPSIDGYEYWDRIVNDGDLAIIDHIRKSKDYALLFDKDNVMRDTIQSMKELTNDIP